ATGWPLRYDSAPAGGIPIFESRSPETSPLWQTELHGDNGLSGRLVLDRPDDSLIEAELPRILALSELLAELVSQAELAQWELECRSQELATLVDIGRLVPSDEDLATSLHRLIKAVVQLTGFRSAAFFLLDPSGEHFTLKSEFHQETRTIPFPKRDLRTEAPDFAAIRKGRVNLAADASPLEALWLPRGTATGVVLGVHLDEGPLGTLWAFDRRHREPELREWHVLESISAQIAGVFERTVLHHESSTEHRLRHDVRIASEQQNQNLFRNLPKEVGFESAGFCTSRYELGGDLCEAISLDPYRTVIVLGDACGDSVPAALVMSAIRGAVHSLVNTFDDQLLATDQMMERLNRTLHAVTPPHQFMSLVYLVIDMQNRTLTCTNAGHPAPLHSHQGEVYELESHGVLAGVLDSATYGVTTRPIHTDDLLVLFSDGITEAMSDRCTLFRSRGIIDTVVDHQNDSAQQVLDAITERLKAHTGGIPDDDRTLAVLRFL
ncbi:MAG: SpoIIE family protein phosphatase, partial [Planctomycetaceae bacterium]|nr:SpoIIE family protein phosphatase [Planctomycetaceae bacterium]